MSHRPLVVNIILVVSTILPMSCGARLSGFESWLSQPLCALRQPLNFGPSCFIYKISSSSEDSMG
jgi:hypothetical protein